MLQPLGRASSRCPQGRGTCPAHAGPVGALGGSPKASGKSGHQRASAHQCKPTWCDSSFAFCESHRRRDTLGRTDRTTAWRLGRELTCARPLFVKAPGRPPGSSRLRSLCPAPAPAGGSGSRAERSLHTQQMRGAPVIGALLLPLRRWPVWLAGLACAGWAPGAAAQDCVDTQANCDVLLRAGYQCSSRFGGGLVSDQCQATCDSCASQTQAPPGPPSGPPSGPSAQQQAWTETTIPLDRAPAAEDGATFGQVFVNLDIGTPAQSVRLMIDTSSGCAAS